MNGAGPLPGQVLRATKSTGSGALSGRFAGAPAAQRFDARPGEERRHSPGRAVGGLLAGAGCRQFAGVGEIRAGVTSDGAAVRRCSLVADGGPILQRVEGLAEAGQHGTDQLWVLAVQGLEVGSTFDLVQPRHVAAPLLVDLLVVQA